MKVRIRISESDEIYLPASLMESLGLHDGDLVAVTVAAGALRLMRLGRFLELRGALADDVEFDRAMETIERAWERWTSGPSV